MRQRVVTRARARGSVKIKGPREDRVTGRGGEELSRAIDSSIR